MRLRVASRAACLPARLPKTVSLPGLCCALLLIGTQPAAAQLKAVTAPGPHPDTTGTPPDALLATTTGLFLCVDNSTTYPCPDPVTNDTTYIPAITMTYGETLDGVAEALGPLSGTISFLANGNVFCQLQIGANQTCPQANVPANPGRYVITAEFLGNTEFAPSTSLPVDVTILPVVTPPTVPPGYTLTVAPASATTLVGGSQSLAVTVTPVGGYAQPVTLGCTGLPTEATCSFQEQVIPAGGGSTTLSLSARAPHPCSVSAISSWPQNWPSSWPARRFPAPMLAGFLLLLPWSRFRKMLIRMTLAMLLSTTLLGLNACSSPCTDFATQPGSYSFHVTGTASIDVETRVGLQVNP
jgi:hypothetical protein